MIKNSLLIKGMPLCGKSTRLQKIFLRDLKETKTPDLCINLFAYLHRPNNMINATTNVIRSPHGIIPAMSLPLDYNFWLPTLQKFHKQYPHVKHILLDECQCLSAVLLDTLILCIRDYYPHTKVIMAAIDYSSWHKKLSNIQAITKLAEHSKHLTHTCMLCRHRFASRRLHVVKNGHTWKPYYHEAEYNKLLQNPTMRKRATMISVCKRHYYISQSDLNNLMKNQHYQDKHKWTFRLVENKKTHKLMSIIKH